MGKGKSREVPVAVQKAMEEAKTAELKTVVVSASRSQAQVEAMPLNTTIVSQEDIQKSSAQTLEIGRAHV